MSNNRQTASTLVQKVWNYAHVLKDDGLAFMDYTEQITFLLFLRMVHEREAIGSESVIPGKYNWAALSAKSGDALEVQYSKTLRELGKLPGLLGVIFAKAQNKITDPAKLERLIFMIEGENWSGMDVDVNKELWVYDLRTNKNFTLRQNPIADEDLIDFVACFFNISREQAKAYQEWKLPPQQLTKLSRHKRKESERFKCHGYEELMARDKANLDIFWLKDDSLADTKNLPKPAILVAEIIEDLEEALEQFSAVEEELKS